MLYVLDEPTIGLHPRDNRRLLGALQHLRDLGNTLILVEHDREVIAAADYLLDFGPGAGDRGGEITARGTPKQVLKAKASLTGQYLSGKKSIPVPTNRRMRRRRALRELERHRGALLRTIACIGSWLTVKGARQNNLQEHRRVVSRWALSSPSPASAARGKSSLVNEVLYNTLARRLHRARTAGGRPRRHPRPRADRQGHQRRSGSASATRPARTRRPTPASST